MISPYCIAAIRCLSLSRFSECWCMRHLTFLEFSTLPAWQYSEHTWTLCPLLQYKSWSEIASAKIERKQASSENRNYYKYFCHGDTLRMLPIEALYEEFWGKIIVSY